MSVIRRLQWDEANVAHIADHGVTVDEVEDVCFARPLVLKSRRGTRLALGRTATGAYLLVVLRMKARASPAASRRGR
jgi:uncharacterized DUF497 family protein